MFVRGRSMAHYTPDDFRTDFGPILLHGERRSVARSLARPNLVCDVNVIILQLPIELEPP